MGWWGHDIMDGDDPADCRDAIRNLLGLGWNDDSPVTAEMLFDNADDNAALCAERQGRHYTYAYQAWGWMLLEAKASAISDLHRTLILDSIDTDIADLPNQSWQHPVERLHCLQVFRAEIEALGTGKVVDMHALVLTRAQNRVENAMQKALGSDVLNDPSVVQKAIASMLEALKGGDALTDWGVTVRAAENVHKTVAEAVAAGVPLDKVLVAVRPLIGA